jgi:penicillin-binding protein 1A
MSKDDILINYMNTINLGHNTLGVQAASLRYFGKSVSDLTLSE